MLPERVLKARVEFHYADRYAPEKETVPQYWQRIGKTMSGYVETFVNRKGPLEHEIAGVVSPNDPPETKLRKIYARVLQIRNLSMEESKSDKEEKHENLKANENAEDVLKHGYGYGRQINYLFIGLARAAGFEANAVFVSPRNIAFFTPNSMDSSQLNADVVWVRAGTQEYYLDPAARYFPFGSLPWYESSAGGDSSESAGFRHRHHAPSAPLRFHSGPPCRSDN
jgi:hypothetical protein